MIDTMRRQPVVGLVVPLVALIGGVAALALPMADMLLRGSSSESWPSVIAEVIESETRVPQRSRRGRGYTTLHIRYAYHVEGRRHESTEIMAGSGNSRGIIRERAPQLELLAPGDQVEAFYDPRSPGSAVLVRGGARSAPIGLLLIGLAIAGLGAMYLFVWFMVHGPVVIRFVRRLSPAR